MVVLTRHRCLRRDSSRIFKIAFGVLTAALIWYLVWTPETGLFPVRRSPTDVVSDRKYNALVETPFNFTIGLIWPRPGREPNDRIRNQINLMESYARTSKRNRSMKVILRVGDFNFDSWIGGQEQFIRDRCPIVDCWLSNDRKVARTADALLITEFSYDWRSIYLPKPARQIWIAQNWESPMHDRIDESAVEDLINWTVSFRRDSTIPISYNRYYPIVGSTPATGQPTVNYAAGRTKKVAWFVSNCEAKNNRLRYAVELSKYIQVDIYGKCGKLECPRSSEKSCLEMLTRDYKFYLSFENSNCDDYITEKFTYNALQQDIVPIAMGARREDYDAMGPPHSFIHVDDFSGPSQLADFLHVLDRNDTLYNEYFAWKGFWSAIDERYWCRLCMLLHYRDEVSYVSWYHDYRQWWNGGCDRDRSLSWFQRNRDI